MLVGRILATLLVVMLGATLATYLITKDRRWLGYSGRILRIGVFILLILFILYALERFAFVV